MIAFILAQVGIPTPPPNIETPSPPPLSERVAISRGLDHAASLAKALGGTLGAVVMDLGTGSIVDLNADTSLPMQSVQKLPLAILIYRSIDAGAMQADQTVTITDADIVRYVSTVADNYPAKTAYSIADLTALMLETSDNSAARALLRVVGGVDTANRRLTELGYGGILVDANDNGFAKPATLASMLADLQSGKIVSPTSRATLLGMLAKATTYPGRLRAGFPPGTLVEHKTGTSGTENGVTDATNDVAIVNVLGRTLVIVAMLHGAKGDEASRDAILAEVGRAAYQAAAQFPI